MDLIAGRYKMIRRLGSGGMAEVWLAEQQGPDGFARRTVVKRVHAHLAEQEGFVASFRDEARVAALFHHPNIVKVEDYGEHDGLPYLVLAWVDGRDLRSLATEVNGQDERLPTRLILTIGVQIAEALDYVHKLTDDQDRPLSIVHRDVSPQNIMVTTTGQAKLLDFGVARAATNEVHTRTGVLKGKLAYLSPEQAKTQIVTPKSDQFSLGVVLWELLTGARLFASESDMSTLQQVVFGDIPSMAVVGGRLPSPLVRTIDRCLHRNPAERFETCGELAQALRFNLNALGGPYSTEEYAQFETDLAAVHSIPKPLPFLSKEARDRTESHEALRAVSPEETNTRNELPTQPDHAAATVLRHQVRSVAPSEDLTELHPALTSVSASQLEVHQITNTIPHAGEEVTQVTSIAPAATKPHAMPTSSPIFALSLVVMVGLLVGLAFWLQDDAPSPEMIANFDQGQRALAAPNPSSNAPRRGIDDPARRALRQQRQLNRCRSARTERSPVRVTVKLTLQPAGGAPEVAIKNADPSVHDCITRLVATWNYPPFSGTLRVHRMTLDLR
jgi:serine/threonine protein kinase